MFLSYHRANAAIARSLCDALQSEGLAVFIDDREIEDFEGITQRLSDGLARSKALLAVFSETYPTRRACQFELTAAFLAGQQAEGARARVLVVNPEDGVAHIEPGELRDAVFRRLRETDAPRAVSEVAQSVGGHVRRLQGVLGDVQPMRAVAWYGYQPAGSPLFVGRNEAMWKIHSALHASELRPMTGAAGPGIAQLRGIGGVGKTLLAEEYALRFAPAFPGGVFWLNMLGASATVHTTSRAERDAERTRQLRTLAGQFGTPVAGLTDPRDVEAAFRLELERRGKAYLWLVDDIPDGLAADEVRAWLAPGRFGKTLLTTRSRRYDSLAATVEPGVLALQDATELLVRHRPPVGDSETNDVERLAEDLGLHALAIEVAGAALAVAAGPTPYADFRAALGEPGEDELEFAADLANALSTGHDPSIANTLLSSIVGLGEDATDLLRLASLVANAPMPSALVDDVIALADGLDQRDARRAGMRARRDAERASLLDRSFSGEAHTVHPLVARAMRYADRNREARREQLHRSAVTVLAEKLGDPPWFASEPPDDAELLIPHARHLLTARAGLPELTLASCVARYDYERGAFSSARELGQRVLDGRRQLLGERHPETLTAMGRLAATLSAQGESAEARPLVERAFHGRRELFGEHHPDTLRAMNILAVHLREEDPVRARGLGHSALDGLKELLGERHPDTLAAMGNLAITLQMQADLEAGRELQQRMLDGLEELLGEGHPATLRAMSTLASMDRAGGPAQVRDRQQRAYDGVRNVLGEGHPETLAAMGNLARTLEAQGDFTAARELEERLLEGFRDLYGEAHPSTLYAMNLLAATLHSQRDFDAARELEHRALDALRGLLGERHPDTLGAMAQLAATLREQGDLDAARDLGQQALQGRREVLGERDPQTLRAMSSLAATLHTRQDFDAARQLAQEALAGYLELVGERHINTLGVMSTLAATLHEQGELEAAGELGQRALDGRLQVLGERHPDTLATMSNLATTRREQGQFDAARELAQRVFDGYRHLLGERHPDTVRARTFLDATELQQGAMPVATGAGRFRQLWRANRRSR